MDQWLPRTLLGPLEARRLSYQSLLDSVWKPVVQLGIMFDYDSFLSHTRAAKQNFTQSFHDYAQLYSPILKSKSMIRSAFPQTLAFEDISSSQTPTTIDIYFLGGFETTTTTILGLPRCRIRIDVRRMTQNPHFSCGTM